MAAGGCDWRPPDNGWGRDRQPVINVSWKDAQAYAFWLSEKAGRLYRLLSEAEREYAAPAGTTTPYPWGNAVLKNGPNFDGSDSRWSGSRAAPVGSFPANASGLHDMIGNVVDWVQDCWNESYEGGPADGRTRESGDCGRRVLRGGSWYSAPANARTAYRARFEPEFRRNSVGLRLAGAL